MALDYWNTYLIALRPVGIQSAKINKTGQVTTLFMTLSKQISSQRCLEVYLVRR